MSTNVDNIHQPLDVNIYNQINKAMIHVPILPVTNDHLMESNNVFYLIKVLPNDFFYFYLVDIYVTNNGYIIMLIKIIHTINVSHA